MRLVLSLALALLGSIGCGGREDRPNVILLVMDTTRGDHCSVNGYERPTTPQLEKLAGEALLFRNAWSPAGWTGPAHASMFTGLRPNRHGYFIGSREFLDQRAITLAERLRNAGYRTACFSNNSYVSAEHGLTQGFQHVVPLHEDETRPYPPSIATHDLALSWVKKVRADGAPFLLFINDMEPHLPYTPPEEFAARFLDPTLDPETVRAAREMTALEWHKHNLGVERVPDERVRALRGLYDAEIACLDDQVGRLIEALREEGVLNESLLIVTSDHGENLGDHGLLSHTFGLYRSLRYVPLIVRLPGGARAGEVSDQVVRLEDIYPTIVEFCGLPAEGSIDALSLLWDVSGRQAIAMRGAPIRLLEQFRQEEKLVFDMSRLAVGISATFDGRYHRIDYSDGRVEVFDVLADPSESRSVE